MDLLVREPEALKAAGSSEVDRQQELLEQVIQPMQRVFQESTVNRKEARVWLMTSLSQLPASRDQAKRFAFLLSEPRLREKDVASSKDSLQLIQLVLQHSPRQAAPFFLKQPAIFKKFFRGNETRIRQWFSHFQMSKLSEFGYGAKALASYALNNRDNMWDLLEWEGKHPQAPVAVVAKPHYFSQLNIVRTIGNLADDCPDFWTSEEFCKSMANGELLTSHAEYFSKILLEMLLADDRISDGIRSMLLGFLDLQPFQRLCQGLLPHVTDADLLEIAEHLLPAATPNTVSGSYRHTMQQLLFGSIRWKSLSELLLYNALALHERALKQVLCEDDTADAYQEILDAITKYHASIGDARQEWALRVAIAQGSGDTALKQLVLRGWMLTTDVAACIGDGPEAVHAMLRTNGLGNVQAQPPAEAHQPGRKRKERKERKRHKKKYKKRRSISSDSGSDSLGGDDSDGLGGEPLEGADACVVKLSLNGEKLSCSLADLQAPLCDFIFRLWTQWLVKNLHS